MIGSMVGLTVSADAFNIFILFELMSVSSFVLVAFRKQSWEPIEAGFKYIIISVVGSFLALLGIALMFMYTGQLSLSGIAAGLVNVPREPKLLMLALVIAGFGVKAAIVPLHTWLPDAHSAAPSSISALLSGIVIQTGLFVMLRILLTVFAPLYLSYGLVLILFGILTMTVGNITAIQQTDLKRMLAYSSVAQMGYILLGIGLGLYYPKAVIGLDGGFFHIMTHAVMKGLAFMCAGALIHAVHTRELSKLRGIGWRMPVTAVFFGLAALGLAGVPPFAGFMSKLFIYEAGIQAGTAFGYVLAGIAILNSVISLGYYLPALSTMFAREAGEPAVKVKEAPLMMLIPTAVLAGLTVLLGVWPEFGLKLVYPAVQVVSTLLKGGI
jgi:proton-translocating NADH-quinone oxidoreductase chain N